MTLTSRVAATRIGVFALPLSIAIWTAAIHLSRLDLTGFGLVTGIHPSWYAAVGLGTGGMLIAIYQRRHSVLLTAYAMALLVMITSTAVLLENTPRFPYVFDSYRYGDEILRNRVINFAEVYLSWPGWHVVTSTVVEASRIHPVELLTWAPLWLSAMVLVALTTLFRRLHVPRGQRWTAIALALTTLLGPVYPLPASAALILLIYGVALQLEGYTGSKPPHRSRFGLILVIGALVPTHLLTSAVGTIVFAVTALLVFLVTKRSPGNAWVISFVVVAAYLFFVAVEVTAQLFPRQVDLVLAIDQLLGSIFGSTAHAISGGSLEHLQIVRIRIVYVVGLATLAVLGAASAVARRVPVRRWVMPVAWIVGGLSSVIAGPYGGEILARGAALAAPGSLVLASWLGRSRIGGIVIAVAILVGAVFSPLNHFGNELFDYVRPSELAADATLRSRHPEPWNLVRESRTWFAERGAASSGPFVVVYGPLYDETSAHLFERDPPVMPYWSYNNGDLQIMITEERLQ